jgi:hypothetical protein
MVIVLESDRLIQPCSELPGPAWLRGFDPVAIPTISAPPRLLPLAAGRRSSGIKPSQVSELKGLFMNLLGRTDLRMFLKGYNLGGSLFNVGQNSFSVIRLEPEIRLTQNLS